ncbi:MAG TPA: hypothetical protein DCY88_30015 [Cyanobacteria bacterium UBA11372]|nr:hypothetical protein [Cyanobacteria bacterium UBA11372]
MSAQQIYNENIKLICIDGSKFIEPDNPAAKIYTVMVKHGCPKCNDGTPKTMPELQSYWDLLETDKHVVLVFYNPDGTALQGFSDVFLNALSKFDGAVCVVTEQCLSNTSLKCFSQNQPQLVENIVGWIRAIALEA